MDLKKFYDTIGYIYLSVLLVLASIESHEILDTTSLSDDQLLLIKTETTTEPTYINADSNSLDSAENGEDASGNSIPTTKQQEQSIDQLPVVSLYKKIHEQNIDPSSALSSNHKSHDQNSLQTQKRNGTSKHSSKHMDHNIILAAELSKKHQNENDRFLSIRQQTEIPYLATSVSTKIPPRNDNTLESLSIKQNNYNADQSVTMMTNHPGFSADLLTHRLTKPHTESGPLVQLSTKQLTYNDDPLTLQSTKHKVSIASKPKHESDPVSMLTTKPKVDTMNEFTVRPGSTLYHDIETPKSSTTSKKPTTFSIESIPVPKNVQVTSATEESISLSLEPLSPGQRYIIEITPKQDSNLSRIYHTKENEFTIQSLSPGTLYNVSVRIIMHELKGEAYRLENNTVPIAPELIITKTDAGSVMFSIKKDRTLCKVHIDTKLKDHSRINEDLCILELTRLCPGRKYSMNVWRTLGVWKSQPTTIDFTTTQKRNITHEVHGNTLTIKWEELKLDGCPILSYKVYLNDGKTTTTDFCEEPEYRTTIRTGSTYTFQVMTIYRDGDGELSQAEIISVRSKLPGEVQFEIKSVDATTVWISLQPPQQMNQDIFGYLITITTENNKNNYCHTRIINCSGCAGIDQKKNPSLDLPASCKRNMYCNPTMTEVETLSKTFKIDGLSAYQKYRIVVRAYNRDGCANGKGLYFTTTESIPSQVEDLRIIKMTNTSLEFQWKQPCYPNGKILNYRVDYNNQTHFVEPTQYPIQSGKLAKLHPYRMYTIQVSACTAQGCSTGLSVKNRTLAGVPMNVLNVKAETVSSTSVYVCWDLPRDKMGPTDYSVDVIDKGRVWIGCEARGFQSRGCNVTGLDEYWQYTFKVTAHTPVGDSYPMKSQQIRTFESTPGYVTKLEVKCKCYTKIYVKWEPPAPRNRNGIIRKYWVTLLGDNGLNQQRIVNVSHRYQEFKVKPEHNITVQVRAATNAGKGLITEETVFVPAGPPAIPDGILFKSAPFHAKDRSQQIAIMLPMKFFSNDSNGKPVTFGLIVAQSEAVTGNNTPSQMLRDQLDLKSMRRWQEVHDQTIIQPYRPTAEDWKPPIYYRDGKYGNNHYILGADKQCQLAHHYCNGYLQPGKSYRIKAFMCTNGGCSETRYSGLFYTEKDMSAVYITTPILLMMAVVSLAAVFFMWRKQLFCFHKHTIAVLSEVTSSVKRTAGETNKSFVMNLERMSRRYIRLDEFHEKVENMKKDSNLLFCEEFQLLRQSSPSKTHSAAELQANRTKNRYTNILAFDHSRVKLLPLDDDEGSDYINANYMPGYQSKREYIAAQGPLPGTKDDFWRMIWEQNVSVVVMVTQSVERGRIKCEIYWPTGTDPVYFGDLVVQLRSESNLNDYVHRILDVQLGEEKREVKHFHFLKWPDFGCPANTSLLINFIQTVRSYMPYTTTGPTIIHCSAGVGRTGTFIAIDWLLQHIREHSEVDIFGLILELRNYRVNMVQTEDQYIFIHQCIADHLRQIEGTVDEDALIDDTPM